MSLLHTEQRKHPLIESRPKDLIEGSLVVSIVNWEQADLTIDCLHSVAGEVDTVSDCHVIVVDNGSRDDPLTVCNRQSRITAGKSWTTLVRAPSNFGFAAGNNIALALSERSRQDGRNSCCC